MTSLGLNFWNCGVEGETDDLAVRELRARQQRNFLASLLLSQGTPMLLAGDEINNTQQGNNNAYCQDNELSWIDWSGLDSQDRPLLAFTRALIKLRREHIVLRRGHFFVGQTIPGTDTTDIVWLNADGTARRNSDWSTGADGFLAFMISGEAGEYHVTMSGEHAHDVTLLVGMNTSAEELQLWLPHCQVGTHWEWLIDTSREDGLGHGRLACGDRANVAAHSLIMLVSVTAPDTALVPSPAWPAWACGGSACG